MLNIKINPVGAPIASCDADHGCAKVTCETCLEEIPSDLALSHEGPDYVRHFCGLNCLEQWQESLPESK